MKTVIFLGGEKPSTQLASREAADATCIIAADSGFLAAEASGITPHILVGDFDSLPNPPRIDRMRVIEALEQDATDFQKALRHVPKDCRQLVVLGGTGLRSDHFLTNLLVGLEVPERIALVFIDDFQEIHRVVPHAPLRIELPPESTVSLIPFSFCTSVNTRGLHWNLHDQDMGPLTQLGQSNRVDTPQVEIAMRSGSLYFVINTR